MAPSRCLAVLLVAFGAAACLAQDGIDDEAVTSRTAMLDKLADEGMPMLHASNKPPPSHDTNLGESAESETEKQGLGQLGESDEELTELEQDVKQATEETEGMFDSDVRAARAFSNFDNDLDDLKAEVEDLEAQTNIRKASGDYSDGSKHSSDLGEGDSKNVLEENKEDLMGDMSVKVHVDDTPATIAGANHLLHKMGAKTESHKKSSDSDSKDKYNDDSDDQSDDQSDEDIGEDDKDDDSAGHSDDDEDDDDREDDDDDEASDDDDKEDDDTSRDSEVTMLDETQSFIQDEAGSDGTSLAQEDLASSDKSLVSRAHVEAAQADRMSAASVDDKIHKAEDYMQAAAAEEKYSSSMNAVDKTMLDQLPTSQNYAQTVVDNDETSNDLGDAEEEVEQSKLKSYVTSEASKEAKEINAAEARERKMEDKAKEQMLAEIKSSEESP